MSIICFTLQLYHYALFSYCFQANIIKKFQMQQINIQSAQLSKVPSHKLMPLESDTH